MNPDQRNLWPKESSSIFTFIPCQREIALNGLSALSVRKLLNAVRFELPSTAKLTTETCTSMRNVVWAHLVRTHDHDDEVEASPDAAKVAPESESDPLEKHLDGEEDGEDKVDNLQDEFQLLIVLEVDIFKAEGQTANIEYWDIAKGQWSTWMQRWGGGWSTRRRGCRRCRGRWTERSPTLSAARCLRSRNNTWNYWSTIHFFFKINLMFLLFSLCLTTR